MNSRIGVAPERSAPPVNRGVLALSGYGLRVALERGHLLVEDGVGEHRRQGRFSRVGHGIERLIVIGHSGTISFDALRWLHELDIAFVQIGPDGELIATGAPNRLRDVRLLRAQAMAIHTEGGLGIARDLIAEKVKGQARVLDRLAAHRTLRQAVAESLDRIPESDSLDSLRFLEARAASAYWSAWEALPVRFAGRDAKHVPTHWRTFGTRSSPLTSSPRKAATPANAILNYLYAIVEAEARLAALAVGCDPALGVIHTDSRSRDSLACDLMEPVRPHVDASVLSLLHGQTFARNDFFESRDGNCRLMPEIARPLAATALQWGKRVAPVAERIGGAFLSLSMNAAPVATGRPSRSTGSISFRTPLTGRNRSRRTEPQPDSSDRLPNRCRACGGDLGTLRGTYCPNCFEAKRRDAATTARSTLTARMATGADQRSAARVRSAHRDAATRQMRDIAVWKEANPEAPDQAAYLRHIAPALRDVPTRALIEATGLSAIYCRQLKRGERVAHPRRWTVLREVIAAIPQRTPDDWDVAFYVREIAPRLIRCAAAEIAEATGLSESYCKRLRRGQQIARRHHWVALHRLVTA